MPRTLISVALALAMTAPAVAKDSPALTLYHSDDARLFNAVGGTVDSGHAVIHETRTLHLRKGTHDLIIGDLPDYLDPEAVTLGFSRKDAQVVSQRLLLPRGNNGTIAGHIGKQITVIGDNGQNLAQGTLVKVGSDGSLVIGGDVFGPTVIHDYAAVKLTGGKIGSGSRLQVRVDSAGSRDVQAALTYPAAGLGWRAAYSAMLEPGHTCRLRIHADASIANRSGRDWDAATVKLVAGQPRFAKNGGVVRPMMARAAAAPAMPQQATLGDYRTFTLKGVVDLPDHTITVAPLYDAHTVDCQREHVYENGNTWQPPRPTLAPGSDRSGHDTVISSIAFTAFDSFPAGYLRVLETDRDGHAELLGEDRIADTPKDGSVRLTLGKAFDLRGERQRTSFQLDRSNRQLDEAFTVTLTNSGEARRVITVREHPNRWRNWTLTSSSIQPSRQTSDTLEFRVAVPAHGKATLDYAVRYTWNADVN